MKQGQKLVSSDALAVEVLHSRQFQSFCHLLTDTEDMYFRLGFSHRFTSPILLYIVRKMTGIDFSCSDIQWTPKGWLDINDNSYQAKT